MAATERFRLNLRAAIERKGESIASVARKLGADRSHLTNVINGKNSITIEMAEQVAGALGIDLVELFAHQN